MQELADPNAVRDPLVELEMQVGREAEVRQSRAELAADEAFGVFQAVNRRLPAVVFGHDADLDGGIPQVRGELTSVIVAIPIRGSFKSRMMISLISWRNCAAT